MTSKVNTSVWYALAFGSSMVFLVQGSLGNAALSEYSQNPDSEQVTVAPSEEACSNEWIPPQELRDGFPYYFSGYDYDGRPVIVTELGKFKYQAIIQKGKEALMTLDKYTQQMFDRGGMWAAHSPTKDIVIIMDFEYPVGAPPDNTETILLQRKIFMQLYGMRKVVHNIISVNANFQTQTFLSYIRPVMAELNERFEVYGTNPVKFTPHLLRLIPRDQLAPAYGGTTEFVPLWRNNVQNSSCL